MIPVANPSAGYRRHKAAIDAAALRALDSGWYIMGQEVSGFEREFAEWAQTTECVSVGTGTDALILILRAMGIGPGDTVATVSHTAVATVSAIDLVGAKALLVDVDPVSCTMSPDHLASALASYRGGPVKAIIPVHIYGHPAPMDDILTIAAARGIPVIEDCAQAHGARYRDRQVGTMGIAAEFSFYPTKNLGALGDGGAVTTSDAALADACRLIKQYGWRRRYISETNGMNTRLDEIQAAMLRAKLPFLDAENARRREIAAVYASRGANTHVTHPTAAPDTTHVFHQYVVQTDHRAGLRKHLEACGVGTAVLYPMPIHCQPGYSGRVAVAPEGLATTERAAERVLSVPMYPELSEEQIDVICHALSTFTPI